MKKDSIKYFKANEVGEGLPFAYIGYEQLVSSDDIFIPSLRDFHVIFWVKKGKGEFILDFKEFVFESNTLILLSKDQLSYFRPFNKENTEIVSIPFKPEFLYKTQSDLKHLFSFNSLKHNKGENNTLKLDQKTIDKLELICSEMDELYKGSEPFKPDVFYHYLCIFLLKCEVLLAEQMTSQVSINEEDKTIFRFSDLLETHFKEKFSVAFYANQLNITSKVLAKLTKAYYNKSPKSVIDERRLLEIKRLLKGTSKSGKSIALELNFDEPTNMFKFFKKHVGLTPNEFKYL